jgi:hypothetical protein
MNTQEHAQLNEVTVECEYGERQTRVHNRIAVAGTRERLHCWGVGREYAHVPLS